MTYEEEQIKYAEELKTISREIKDLEEILNDPRQLDAIIDRIYGPRKTSNDSMSLLSVNKVVDRSYSMREFARKHLEESYKSKLARKRNLERLLSQSPSERIKENITDGIGKSVDFLGSITPQHVSGRLYTVENGDGCTKFIFWFVLIDAIICGIIFLCTQ